MAWVPLYNYLTPVLEPSATGSNVAKDVFETIQSKVAVETMYSFLAILNLLMYYGVYIATQWRGVFITENIVELLRAQTSMPAGLSFLQSGQILLSQFRLMDIALATFACVIWALLEDGLFYAVAVMLGSVIVGPGAAIAFYAAHRESRIQSVDKLINKGK
ncbi:hypothetical protein EC973_008473 [Apophysomyces ossiformis]|uniref:Uncharacterized protein n=1 Tax=Apophysomyces ossiformis TaxID=679940 RepID=A0A8H7BNH5_9FUNG|nr:hypothetical protein EC973_008473 [Apophysomyces ossiformis]